MIKDQDFVQAVTIELTNGLVITGSYVGPQTKKVTNHKFITETL